MFPRPSYPTPIVHCPGLGSRGVELYVKNDGVTHAVYGGNKVRKAERIIRRALERDKRRILTFGSAGSHHVLTFALFAREHGLKLAAVLTPQVNSEHVEQTLRASLGAGAEIHPVSGALGLVPGTFGALRAGDALVLPGGSGVEGALGYVDAVAELAAEVRAGALSDPNVIVVAVGSGGTAAGILAGLVAHGLGGRVVGVPVARNPFARALVLGLARRTLAALGRSVSARELGARLELDARFLGPGYGKKTPESERAADVARAWIGLELEGTYTGKAFACALERLRSPAVPEPGVVLYWHTLSAHPLEPLLEGAPSLAELPPKIRKLLLSAG